MTSTTTNYGWTVPTSSDLVKNGATAISTVGSSVDTSLWNSGFGQAGKNKIINSDFTVWQRGTTITNPGAFNYTADRWATSHDGTGATRTISRQTFTPGTAPVAGYEGQYFYRYAVSVAGTATYNGMSQRIENVQTFAGQTVTVSFWAKADAARVCPVGFNQVFGSGGSTTVNTAGSSVTLTTGWVRYSQTISVPSIAGKTIGTGSSTELYIGMPAGTFTIDVWGVQVEYGSYATPFQTATGTIQGELAACQRYYYRVFPNATSKTLGQTSAGTTTAAISDVAFPVTMRIAPTALEQSGTASNYAVQFATVSTACSAVPTFGAVTTENFAGVNYTVAAGLVAGQSGRVLTNAAGAYLGWSAEL